MCISTAVMSVQWSGMAKEYGSKSRPSDYRFRGKKLLPVGTRIVRCTGAGTHKLFEVIADCDDDVLVQCKQERWPQQIPKWHIKTCKLYTILPNEEVTYGSATLGPVD